MGLDRPGDALLLLGEGPGDTDAHLAGRNATFATWLMSATTRQTKWKIPLCSVFPSLGKGPSPPGSGGNRDSLTQQGTLSQARWERSSWISSLLLLPTLQFFFSFSVKMGFKTPFLLPPPSESLLYPEPVCCYLFLLF